jgi:hypothetical protein
MSQHKHHHLRDEHLEQHVERIEIALDELFDPISRVMTALRHLREQAPHSSADRKAP